MIMIMIMILIIITIIKTTTIIIIIIIVINNFLNKVSGGMSGRVFNTSNSGSGDLGFKPGGRGTPIHYLYGYVPPNGVVILKLLI